MPLQARKTLAVTGSTQPKDGFFTHSIGRRAEIININDLLGYFSKLENMEIKMVMEEIVLQSKLEYNFEESEEE